MKLTLALTVLTLSISANASYLSKKLSPIKVIPKVIYGQDDRFDVFESSDSLMKELSRSTAAQILNNNLEQNGDTYTIKAHTLEEEGMCKSERFSSQPAAANCSGFLVGPDMLVTAGHCINTVNDCENHAWVFDFANTTEEKASFTFNKSQVYHCTKIIAREKNPSNMNDYAVLRLDRVVAGRTPLKYRKAGKPADPWLTSDEVSSEFADDSVDVVRVMNFVPVPTSQFFHRKSGIVTPSLIVPRYPSFTVTHPGELRNIVGNSFEFLLMNFDCFARRF